MTALIVLTAVLVALLSVAVGIGALVLAALGRLAVALAQDPE